MSLDVTVSTVSDVLGRFARGHMWPHPKPARFDTDQQVVLDFLTAMTRGEALPLSWVTSRDGALVYDGVNQFVSLIGALLPPTSRQGYVLPKWFDELFVVAMAVDRVDDCSTVAPRTAPEPYHLPMNYIPRTMAWLEWRRQLEESDHPSGKVKRILEQANMVARSVLDTRIVLMRVPDGMDPAMLTATRHSEFAR